MVLWFTTITKWLKFLLTSGWKFLSKNLFAVVVVVAIGYLSYNYSKNAKLETKVTNLTQTITTLVNTANNTHRMLLKEQAERKKDREFLIKIEKGNKELLITKKTLLTKIENLESKVLDTPLSTEEIEILRRLFP